MLRASCFTSIAALVVCATSAIAQGDAVSQVREQLLANGGACVIKIEGLHATTDLLGKPSEMHVVNGVVSRGSARFVHGKVDVPLSTGQHARIMNVEPANDPKNDGVRVNLAFSGMTVPVVFVLPHGSLPTMTVGQIQELIAQAIEPASIAAARMPPPIRSSSEASQTPPPNASVRMTPTSPSVGPVGSNTFNPQTAPNLEIPAVAALAKRCKVSNGNSFVKQNGIESYSTTFNARESVIIDGVLQPPPPGFFRGNRAARMPQGFPVQIIDVRAMTDGEHDILHLVLQTNLPFFANVAFVFPKGQLGKLSEPEMEKVIAPFLALPGTFRPTNNDPL